jgi:hypothetical protein
MLPVVDWLVAEYRKMDECVGRWTEGETGWQRIIIDI